MSDINSLSILFKKVQEYFYYIEIYSINENCLIIKLIKTCQGDSYEIDKEIYYVIISEIIKENI